MKPQRLVLNLETDAFSCLSSIAQDKIIKIITMLIRYYRYTQLKENKVGRTWRDKELEVMRFSSDVQIPIFVIHKRQAGTVLS